MKNGSVPNLLYLVVKVVKCNLVHFTNIWKKSLMGGKKKKKLYFFINILFIFSKKRSHTYICMFLKNNILYVVKTTSYILIGL